MKTIFCILAVASSVIAQTNDLRSVNDKTVNLGCVHQWFTNPSTNTRPMPHWKRIKVLQIKNNRAGFYQCAVSIEGCTNREALLANIPKQILATLKLRADFADDAANARQDATAATSARQRQHDTWWNDGQVEQRVSTTTSSHGPAFVDSESARYNRWQQSIQNEQNSREYSREADEIMRDHKTASAGLDQDFAMFTGRTYAQLEVWDFGIKIGRQ